MSAPEIRLSPNGYLAIRWGDQEAWLYRGGTTDGEIADADEVEGWTPLVPALVDTRRDLVELGQRDGGAVMLDCLVCDGENGRPWWSYVLKRDTLDEAVDVWDAHYREMHP